MKRLIIPFILLGTAILSRSADPVWWSLGTPSVIDPAATPNNHGPANIGQAKFMANRALDALRAVLPTLASQIEADLVGSGKPVVTFAVPAMPDAAWQQAQKAPLLVGQLKAIAGPFYEHLNSVSPLWLQGELQANGTQSAGTHFPWTVSTADDNNRGLATIGQLKAVFALHFETLAASLDNDYDDDGLTNAEEVAHHTDPHNPDTDGDGMNDAWEVQWGLDPLRAADASADTDGDNLSNLRESQLGTSPIGIYRIEALPLATNKYFHSAADDGSVVVQQSLVWTPDSVLELVTAPDASGNRMIVPLPPSNWSPLATIIAALVADGTLDPGDSLIPSGPDSSDGTFRVFQAGAGPLMLREPGSYVRSLPSEVTWRALNNHGEAVAATDRYVPSASGISGYNEGDILICHDYYTATIPMPAEWFPASATPLIQDCSDDRVLVCRPLPNPDGSTRYETYQLNTTTGVFTLVRQPGLGGESIVSLSTHNGRMLGMGPKPFQISPDGTPILLAALQIRRSPPAADAPLSTLCPNALVPNHISSDGRITLTTTDASDQPTILQIVPCNDFDNDGMPDDWEISLARMLLASGKSPEEWGPLYPDLASGNLNPTTDYTGDGIEAIDLAAIINCPPSEQSIDGIKLESQQRRNILAWGLHVPASQDDLERNEGLLYYENDGYYGASFGVTTFIQLQPIYLEEQMLSNPWQHQTAYDGWSRFVIEDSAGDRPHTDYCGENRQSRLRLIANALSHLDRTRSYLKVTRRLPYPFIFGMLPEIVEIVPKEPVIPAGRLTSDWIELIPPVVAGFEYTVSLVKPGVAVDADRDGKITFDGQDATTAEKPLVFWVNDDRDMGHTVDFSDWEEDDVLGSTTEYPSDNMEPGVKCSRDLEDLTRVWIDLSGFGAAFNPYDATIKLYVRMEPTVNSPEVTLFQPVEIDGGRKYLNDEDVGFNQLQRHYGEELCTAVNIPQGVEVPRRAWQDLPSDRVVHLLFEGKRCGKGRLVFEFLRGSQVMFTLPPVCLDLKEARDMYETWTVGDVRLAGVCYDTWPAGRATMTSGQSLPPPETSREKDYILFVHGWNAPPWEKEALFASTMFKRLWHLGYKGRFGAFRWPTFHGYPNPSINMLDHFNGSEERAWNSAAALNQLISDRAVVFSAYGASKVRLYGHSMGNIVCSEALRQFRTSAPVHAYVSSQASLSAHCWDPSTPIMTIGGIAFAPSMPDIYAHFWQVGSSQIVVEGWKRKGNPSYLAPVHMPSDVTYVNHYNVHDWALKLWEGNTRMKPSMGKYYYTGVTTTFDKQDSFFKSHSLSFPDDRYEVFSWVAQSHSYATGAEDATVGMFRSKPSVNLDAEPYLFGSTHKGHSGQFRSTIQKRWQYWVQVASDMGIETIETIGN
ncbi:MAG: alpha/beta hydrolase [Verrucomicrobia bacterium]|nr:alpha/beta hydrolase [Verrucomicrobiota bacterium]